MKDFNNLKEVLLGIEFQSIGLDFPLLYGIFYEKIKNEFEKPQFINPTPTFIKNIHPATKRLFFKQKNNSANYFFLIQIQENKFIINCNYKESIKNEDIELLFNKFSQYFSLFKESYSSISSNDLDQKCLLMCKSFYFIEGVGWKTDEEFFSKFYLLSKFGKLKIKSHPRFSFDFIKNDSLTLNINLNKQITHDRKECFICDFNAFNPISNNTDMQSVTSTMKENLDILIKENYKI